MQNKKTSIFSPFFNSESTGFQPTTDQNNCIDCSEKIPTHLSAWPTKLTSVMEIQRQRFSQLNPRFKQQQQRTTTTTTLLQPVQQSVVCPVILPTASRPQPRQQARSKRQQTHLPLTRFTRRSHTAHVKQQQVPIESDPEYITLANLTKILHVLQTQVKLSDSETATNASTSTTNSAKQRVQQHLQETATRWWKPVRSSDYQSTVAAASSVNTYATPSHLLSSDALHQRQQSDSFPLITIVSNSTHQMHIPATNGSGTSRFDESESSTEIQTSTVITPIVQPSKAVNTKRARQEPLIMQARSMRLHSDDRHHQYYNNQNNMNFLRQQRLIRQT